MAYNYDKLYGETPDALGPPTRVFVDFFASYRQQNARVLDVGCGQGRDALFIARQGHSVVGVDLSPNGIRDLEAAAGKEALPIKGVVADITQYKPSGLFDLILVDRTLHMLAQEARHLVLATLLDHVRAPGWMLIADEASNMEGFRAIIAAHAGSWGVEFEKAGYLFVQRT